MGKDEGRVKAPRTGNGWWPIAIGIAFLALGIFAAIGGAGPGADAFAGLGAALIAWGVIARLVHLIELRLIDIERHLAPAPAVDAAVGAPEAI